jgi:hypothetical protein
MPKRSKKPFIFGTYDIETDSKGRLLDIGVYYKNEFKVFSSWHEFFDYLLQEKPILYAHNGGRFDVVSFALWLYRNNIKFSASFVNGAIVNLKIGSKISLRDSYRLMRSSLEELTKAFGFEEGKIKHEFIDRMEEFKKKDPKLYYEYLKRDCVLLYEILLRFDAELKQICDYGNLKSTIGAISVEIYKKAFQPFRIYYPNATERRISRFALHGGRCEVYKTGYIEGVNVYDTNSLYPSIMFENKFPFRGGVRVSEIIRDKEGKVACGFYRVRFRQLKGRLPILINDHKQYAFEGWAWATHFELNYLESLGGVIDEVSDGYHYEFTDYIFRDFVDKIFGMRLSSKEQIKREVYKYVLNNLPGKFAQKEEYETLKIMTLEEARNLLEQNKKVFPLVEGEELGVYSVMEKSNCNFRTFPAIFAFITAAGRCFLTGIMEKYFDNVIYCDTDSIHLEKAELEQDLVDPLALGKFKLQHYNVDIWYFGKKQYVIPNIKVVQKGIPKKAIPSNFLDQMLEIGKVDVIYYLPSLFKTAIRQDIENPNAFIQRYKRIIRQPAVFYMNPFSGE